MGLAEKIAGITFSGLVLAWLLKNPDEFSGILTAMRKLTVGGVNTLAMRG